MMVISRFVRVWFAGVCAALLAAGCQFDASGGSADTDTDGTGSETSTGMSGGGPGGSANPSTSSTSNGEEGDDSTTVTEPDSTTGTTDAEVCDPFTLWVWAEDVPNDATTLQETPAGQLPPRDGEEVIFLRATQGGQGTAAFSFEMPCAATVRATGLVWDAAEGIQNADGYLVGVDMDEAALETDGVFWHYGCETKRRGWSWEQVSDDGEACKGPGPVEFTLEAGPHHLQIANRERVNNTPEFNFTGIAAVVITNDPAFDPHRAYDPTPR